VECLAGFDWNHWPESVEYAGSVVCHPHIIGELACGNLKNRQEIVSLLQALPQISLVEFEEFLYFISRQATNQ
jgi:hypothetical protein